MEFSGFDLTAFYINYIEPFAINFVLAVVIFVVGRWAVGKLSAFSIRVLNRKADADPMLVNFLGNLVYSLGLTMVVIASLGKLGVQTTSLIAVIGAAGLAIGLALQGSLANFAAGVMLLAFKPFRAGHFVEAGGTSGVVENIGIFATTLRTGDNREVIVPNGGIYGGTIVNYSARETRRIDLTFGISYGADIQKAKEVLQDIVQTDPRILRDPKTTIAVGALGDSSVDMVVRPWVASADYWDVLFDLNERVKIAFDLHGIDIPFPTMDVNLPQSVLQNAPKPASQAPNEKV